MLAGQDRAGSLVSGLLTNHTIVEAAGLLSQWLTETASTRVRPGTSTGSWYSVNLRATRALEAWCCRSSPFNSSGAL